MDAADGAVGSGPVSEDLSRVLKKLGYPEIHDNSKPSALMEKAIQACTKRIKKLWEMLPTRETETEQKETAPEPPQSGSSTIDLQEKTRSQHTVFRVKITRIVCCCIQPCAHTYSCRRSGCFRRSVSSTGKWMHAVKHFRSSRLRVSWRASLRSS